MPFIIWKVWLTVIKAWLKQQNADTLLWVQTGHLQKDLSAMPLTLTDFTGLFTFIKSNVIYRDRAEKIRIARQLRQKRGLRWHHNSLLCYRSLWQDSIFLKYYFLIFKMGNKHSVLHRNHLSAQTVWQQPPSETESLYADGNLVTRKNPADFSSCSNWT